MLDDTHVFEGAYWNNITVLEDGSCHPPQKTKHTDRLWVKSAFYMGSGVYNVANLTKNYQCFVQIGYKTEGYGKGPLARCNHPDCIKWQHTQARQKSPCKHVRAACKWHVELTRRARWLAENRRSDE